jgi:hypothetical protein
MGVIMGKRQLLIVLGVLSIFSFIFDGWSAIGNSSLHRPLLLEGVAVMFLIAVALAQKAWLERLFCICWLLEIALRAIVNACDLNIVPAFMSVFAGVWLFTAGVYFRAATKRVRNES